MKRVLMICTVISLLCLSMNVFAEVNKKMAAKDWLTMEKLLDEKGQFLYQNKFEKSPETFINNWQDFSKRFTKEWQSFSQKYGSERQALMTAFEGVDKPGEAKKEHYQLVNELTDFTVERRTKAILEWAEKAAQQNYRGWESMKDPVPEKMELKLKRVQKALKFYEAAQTLNPDGDYSDFIKKAKAGIKDVAPMIKKALEGQTWPDHNPDYAGPGDPDDIAEAALEFLRKNPQWTKPEYDDVHIPYAARVTGTDWTVWKKAPLTHQPTQYSLGMLVAFKGENDKDIAYVYHMVFYTAEENGIKKGLPIRYANSKQYAKYQMLIKNISGGISTSGHRSDSSSAGGFGIWRLLMSLFLIAGGIIAANALIAGKLPQIGGVVKVLTGLVMPIGFILILLGLGGFLCNLVRLAPHASILPQFTALALGIIFIRKSPSVQKNSKVAPILGKFAFLDNMESPLGLVSIVLGFLHLIIGGFGLL